MRDWVKCLMLVAMLTLVPSVAKPQGVIKRQNKESVENKSTPASQVSKQSSKLKRTPPANSLSSNDSKVEVSPEDMLQMGYDFQTGSNGRARNDEDAFYWFKKASENGNVQAKVELALCYIWGNGCSQNKAMGKTLLTAAADAGNTNAMYWIGYAYMMSHILTDWDSFPHDDAMSYYWMMKAAEHGHGKACVSIGLHYSELGDIVNTKYWMKKAIDNGYSNAQKYLDQIASDGKITIVGY